ncbi:hypothetical protein T484DRAFT_1905988, partial [Baffinella frigidus]
ERAHYVQPSSSSSKDGTHEGLRSGGDRWRCSLGRRCCHSRHGRERPCRPRDAHRVCLRSRRSRPVPPRPVVRLPPLRLPPPPRRGSLHLPRRRGCRRRRLWCDRPSRLRPSSGPWPSSGGVGRRTPAREGGGGAWGEEGREEGGRRGGEGGLGGGGRGGGEV